MKKPTQPTCKHCGKPLGSEIQMHRTAGPAGIMRIQARPCDCARAKGERQRKATRRAWWRRFFLGVMVCAAALTGAAAGLGAVTAAGVLTALWTVAAICRWFVFAEPRELARAPKPKARGLRLPRVAPLPQTRRPTDAR